MDRIDAITVGGRAGDPREKTGQGDQQQQWQCAWRHSKGPRDIDSKRMKTACLPRQRIVARMPERRLLGSGMRFGLLCIWLCLLFSEVGAASAPETPQFRQFGVGDGLPSSGI